jgi:hypothetical protein
VQRCFGHRKNVEKRRRNHARFKEEWNMEGTTQEPQGMQGMPPPGALLDRIEAVVAQDPEGAREALDQLRREVMNLSPEQNAQFREALEKRVEAMTPEKQAQLQDILTMLRG